MIILYLNSEEFVLVLACVKILNKFIGVIALIGLLVSGSVWYAAAQMTTIDDAYSQFIVHEAKAAANALRISRYVIEFNYSVYRTIAETNPEQMHLSNVRFDEALPRLKKVITDLREQAPTFLARIDAVDVELKRFISEVAAVRALAVKNQDDQAIDLIHRTIDPQFDSLLDHASKLAEDIATYMEKGSDDLTDQTNATRRVTMALSAAALLFGGAMAAIVAVYGITRPLNALRSTMARLVTGDTSLEVPGRGRKDELGPMAESVQVFKDNIIRTKALEEETAFARASAEEQRKRTMLELADRFETAVGGIVSMLSSSSTELQATAQAMTATAAETASQSSTVAAAAEEAASNVSTVAAAAEELGSSVQEIGRQVSGSANLARSAVTEADQTATLVHELSRSAARIGDVVGLISNIAGQTNLLALNATIEAARAGESGRGFAVVATEVKELASQTAKATDQISSQITQIQSATDQAVKAIGSITSRIRDIDSVATTIAAAVEEQGAATQEIVRNVTQASVGTNEVTNNISGVALAAEATGAAASQVLTSASELSRQSENLGSEVGKFLATVRAA